MEGIWLGVRDLVHPMGRELRGIFYLLLPGPEAHMMPSLNFYCYDKLVRGDKRWSAADVSRKCLLTNYICPSLDLT